MCIFDLIRLHVAQKNKNSKKSSNVKFMSRNKLIKNWKLQMPVGYKIQYPDFLLFNANKDVFECESFQRSSNVSDFDDWCVDPKCELHCSECCLCEDQGRPPSAEDNLLPCADLKNKNNIQNEDDFIKVTSEPIPGPGSGFPTKSPTDILPVPKVVEKNQHQSRKRGKTTIITSYPYKQQLMEMEATLKGKFAKILKKIVKKTFSYKGSTKRQVEDDEESDAECLYCGYLYSMVSPFCPPCGA
ncbi:hypothetical protein FQR65_LT03901 [Abscondita terminalis]|nr:hypothetical protein FQR65_LT03901 [Abscondita terminalis]